MTYVLLVVREGGYPDYFQGTIEEINKALHRAVADESIELEDWKYNDNWKLLAIEDGKLTEVGNYHCAIVPQFEIV